MARPACLGALTLVCACPSGLRCFRALLPCFQALPDLSRLRPAGTQKSRCSSGAWTHSRDLTVPPHRWDRLSAGSCACPKACVPADTPSERSAWACAFAPMRHSRFLPHAVPQLLLSACQRGAGLDAQLAVVQCVAVDGLPFDDPGLVYTEADWKRYHHGGFSDDEDDLFTLGACSSAPYALALFSSLALFQRARMLALLQQGRKHCSGAATGCHASPTRCARVRIAATTNNNSLPACSAAANPKRFETVRVGQRSWAAYHCSAAH